MSEKSDLVDGSLGRFDHPAFPILSYCASSILMTVTNKYVLSGLNFNLNFFLLAVQSLVGTFALLLAKKLGVLSFKSYDTQVAKRWFPVALLLVGMIYTGSWALRFLSIPVYTIFKNLTIILIAYAEVFFRLGGGNVTPLTLLSFVLMVFGSVVAAWADIQYAIANSYMGGAGSTISTLNTGYIWMLLNCFTTAAFVLGMRSRIKSTGFSDFDTTFYNNLLSVPVLFICTFLLEDWSSANLALNFPLENRNAIIWAMVLSGLSAIFISYTSAWCVRATSSTTYSMVGSLNKLPLAISGLIFFDAPATFGSISAIAIGFISGIVYTIAKQKQSSQTAKKEDPLLPIKTGDRKD